MVERLSSYAFNQMIMSGASSLMLYEHELNRMNVFPVADGDTGSNMAYLMKSIMREMKHQDELLKISSIKQACIRGSRGNSGMILSQFIMTMCDFVMKNEKIGISQFVDMCELCVKQAYSVVRKPVEGTILSVMKDWELSLKRVKHETRNIIALLEQSTNDAHAALENTKQQMTLLEKHNVVDAGAKGFYHMLEGFVVGLKAMHSDNSSSLYTVSQYVAATNEQPVAVEPEIEKSPIERVHANEQLNYRYCSEFVFENMIGELHHYKAELELLGDSMVVIGDESYGKIHIHTNSPDQVAALLKKVSTVTYEKVEDMQRQQEMQFNRLSNIAIVVDSACDLPQEILDQHQIHVIPLTLSIEEASYMDKRTIMPEAVYRYATEGASRISTSLPSIEAIQTLYTQLLDHYDHIVAIHVSGQLSGTYNASLNIATQLNSERIHVLDSKTLSGAYGLLVLQMASFINHSLKKQSGDPIQLIEQECRKQTEKQEIVVTVPTLTSMVRSGRVSPMKGVVARMLKLKPLVSVDEQGASKLLRPTIFSDSNIPRLIHYIERIHKANSIQSYVILYTDQQHELTHLGNEMKRITGKSPAFITTVSTVIGIHAGSGAYSIAMTLSNLNERSYL